MQLHYHYPEPSAMSIAEQKSHVPELLEKVDDQFFSAVYAMLETYVRKQEAEVEDPIIGYNAEGEPQYASVVGPIYDERVRAAKEDGAFITLEELKQEAETW